jgi:hypothetical protein
VRIPTWLGGPTVVVVALLAASCASGPPSLSVARNDCAAVGRLLAAPTPAGQSAWMQEIASAPPADISSLDGAMHDLALALHGSSVSATNQAVTEVITACVKLKLWRVYH